LPLTGGGLAKLVVDGPLGDGTASKIATVSAIGTTVLMLQFLRSLLNNVSQDPEAKAAAGLVVPWLTVAAGSIIMPWILYLIPSGTLPDPLAPAAVWKALWPVLLGAGLAIALWRWGRWLERAPQEDIGETESRVTKRAVACGKAIERMDAVLRSWPAAGLLLVILVIAFGEAILVR